MQRRNQWLTGWLKRTELVLGVWSMAGSGTEQSTAVLQILQCCGGEDATRYGSHRHTCMHSYGGRCGSCITSAYVHAGKLKLHSEHNYCCLAHS